MATRWSGWRLQSPKFSPTVHPVRSSPGNWPGTCQLQSDPHVPTLQSPE
jgi:hypothetical protein